MVREALPLRGAAAPLRARRALRDDVARAEGQARRAQNSALGHVDVARRRRGRCSRRGPGRARALLRRGSSPRRCARARPDGSACRRSSRRRPPPRRGARARGRRRAGSSSGPSASTTTACVTLVAERAEPAAQRRSGAARPVGAVHDANIAARVGERVRPFDDDDLVEPRTAPAARAPPGGAPTASGVRSGSRRPRPGRRAPITTGRDRDAANDDPLRRLLGLRVAEGADPVDDGEAGDDVAEHGVDRRQPGVGARDDEELAAAPFPAGRSPSSPSRPCRAGTSCPPAARRPSSSPARRCRCSVGSPPWITKPGTIRWKIVPSKNPLRASCSNDATVCGESFTSS